MSLSAEMRKKINDILVFGYIRYEIELLTKLSIPFDIKKLCHTYWGSIICDEWENEKYIKSHCIETDGIYIKVLTGGWVTVYGKHIYL